MKKEGTVRPSGHVLGKSSWEKNNGGAIPPNLLQISNSESNSQYLRYCKACGVKGHPAGFLAGIPEFFIKFLTDKGDLLYKSHAYAQIISYHRNKICEVLTNFR